MVRQLINNGDFESLDAGWDATVDTAVDTRVTSTGSRTPPNSLQLRPTEDQAEQMQQTFSSPLWARSDLSFWVSTTSANTSVDVWIHYKEVSPDLVGFSLGYPAFDSQSFDIEADNDWHLKNLNTRRFQEIESVGFGFRSLDPQQRETYGGASIYVDDVSMLGDSPANLRKEWRAYSAIFLGRVLADAMADGIMRGLPYEGGPMNSAHRPAPRKAAADSSPESDLVQRFESRIARIESAVEQLLDRGQAEPIQVPLKG